MRSPKGFPTVLVCFSASSASHRLTQINADGLIAYPSTSGFLIDIDSD